ncbi:MAG: NUDIX domain-containing protein [Actinomycetota bacterium]|nr:NUDIX domain-containing protein [Actinomycetota bacterium]MEC8975794.1 NUDIX domain-containing protein [Actinomycetota bacterium]
MVNFRSFLFRIYRSWVLRRPARLTIGVRALVVDDQNRICLVRHSYREGWYLPGGGVKTGESLVGAMQRELLEETGIELPETPQEVHGVFSSFKEHKSDHVVVFVVTDWSVGSSVSPEIAEVGFFGADEVPQGTSAATTRRIKEHMTGVPPGHRW